MICGSKYAVLGTVNYYVQNEDGGHYITYFFPSPNECLTIHESESKPQWKKPDFDAESVIVALQKIDGKLDWLICTKKLKITIFTHFLFQILMVIQKVAQIVRI